MLHTDAAQLLKTAIEDVAMFTLTGRSQIEITGADRASFLHNFCTNHITGLAAGHGGEAIVTSIKGRSLFYILVFAAADRLWIETEAGQAAALLTHLDRYIITEDVQLADRTAELGQLYLSGARGEALLSEVFETPVILPARMGQVLHEGVQIRRFSFGSAPGCSLVVPVASLDSWRSKLTAAGVVEGPTALFEALRIEAGFPKQGVDLSEDNLAQEANRTKLAISFTKGCYLGQEPIARIDAMGHVNRSLCGVTTDDPAEFPAGTDVFATREAQTSVGTLTSAAVWPLTGRGIGLGMLRREITRDGAECYVGSTRIPAHVRIFPGR